MNLREALTILEIDPEAPETQAAKTYKDLIRVWHPDNFSVKSGLLDRATAKTKLLNEAWEVYQKALSGEDQEEGPSQAARAWQRYRRTGSYQTVAIVVLSIVVAVGLVAFLAASDFGQPDLHLAKELARLSFESNRSLPADIDEETRFTSTFAGPGKRFTSVYLLKNVTREQVGRSYFDQVKPALLAHVRSKRGQDEAMKIFEAQGVTLAFAFRDKDGNDVITIDILPQDYTAP